VELGLEAYRKNGCDALIALGGGSPMDTAKVIRFMAVHPGPLAQYDDAKGGDKLITKAMPPLYAVPTTSGTGSEVGRSGVIILRATGKKTIFFHPKLMPDIAVLEPALTAGLPPHITAATGIDAFTHCLEAYFVNAFHPLADGIAQEGIRLILRHLPVAYADGKNLESRGAMQMAAAMGATAFQKGLGMIHSLAHPLSARYNTHHGLANALLLPDALAFLESRPLDASAKAKLARVQDLFEEAGLAKATLSESCRSFFKDLGVPFGLRNHKVPQGDLEPLAGDAFEDTCHASNIIPVKREDMLAVYRAAF
jgi:4-hydroxybutyrate dehydrogenase